MRFGLKCLFCLCLIWRAILLSQGAPEPAALATTAIAKAVPMVQDAARREIAARIEASCTTDPAACLGDAVRLARLVPVATDAPEPARHRRHGAVAAEAR